MEETDKLITIPNIDYCYICGAKLKESSGSFHVWEVEYTCGCKVYGAIGSAEIYLNKKCPNE